MSSRKFSVINRENLEHFKNRHTFWLSLTENECDCTIFRQGNGQAMDNVNASMHGHAWMEQWMGNGQGLGLGTSFHGYPRYLTSSCIIQPLLISLHEEI